MTMRYFGVRGKGRNSSIHFHGRTYMYYRYSKRYSNFYKLMNRIFIMFLFFFFFTFQAARLPVGSTERENAQNTSDELLFSCSLSN